LSQDIQAVDIGQVKVQQHQVDVTVGQQQINRAGAGAGVQQIQPRVHAGQHLS